MACPRQHLFGISVKIINSVKILRVITALTSFFLPADAISNWLNQPAHIVLQWLIPNYLNALKKQQTALKSAKNILKRNERCNGPGYAYKIQFIYVSQLTQSQLTHICAHLWIYVQLYFWLFIISIYLPFLALDAFFHIDHMSPQFIHHQQ